MAAPEAQVPQVAPGDLPNVKAQEQLPLQAAGGGPLVEQQAAVGEQLGEHVGRAIQLETMKANQTSTADRAIMLSQISTKYLYGDPQTNTPGYLAQRGRNAADTLNPMMEQSDKEMQAVLDSAPNENVKRMVLKEYATQKDGMLRQAHAHLMEQNEVAAKDTMAGTQEQAMDAGWKSVNTPDEHNQIVSNRELGAKGILSYYAGHQGDIVVNPDGSTAPGDETKAALDQYYYKYDAGVIQSYLAQKSPEKARAYLEANKDSLEKNPEGFKVMEKAVGIDYGKQVAGAKAGDLMREAQKQKGPDGKPLTLDQQLGWAWSQTEDMQDDDQRKAINSHLNEAIGNQKKLLDHTTQSQQAAIFGQADQGNMPDALTLAKGGMDADKVRAYIQMRKDNKLATDPNTLYSLKDMANSSDPKDRGDFANTNLWDYRTKLSDPDFKALQAQQARLRNPKAGDEAVDHGYRAQTQVGNEVMLGLGMDPGKSKDPGVVAFRQALESRIGEAEKASKAPLDRGKIQDIAKHLAVNVVNGSGAHVPLYSVGNNFASVDVEDIPKPDLGRVDASLKRQGLPLNDTNRKIKYAAFLKVKYAQ